MTRLARLLALVAALAAFVAALAMPAPAAAKAPLFSKPAHRGSAGRQVAAAQWLLSGEAPNAYRKTIHPFRGRKITGQFGTHTAEAVLRARWLLGEPVGYRKSCRCRPGKRPTFDRDLYLLLTARKARPIGWIGTASKRMTLADRAPTSKAATTACGYRIVSIARSQLGVHEIPGGSNDGPGVRLFQSVTGAYRAPWCASFDQWVFRAAGVGTIADKSAGVYYIVDWAKRHTWLRSTPQAGGLVAYLRAGNGRIVIDSGHIGIVESVTKEGFSTLEGNSTRYRGDPWGGGVVRHFRRFGDSTVFIYPPCLTAALAKGR